MMDATNGCRFIKFGKAYRDTIHSRRYRAFRYLVESEGFITALKKFLLK